MRWLIALGLTMLASTAAAEPVAMTDLKWITHDSPIDHGVLQQRVRALTPQLGACGHHDRREAVVVRMSIARDGSIAGVEVRSRALPRAVRECVVRHLQSLRYPARRRRSLVQFALLYHRPVRSSAPSAAPVTARRS